MGESWNNNPLVEVRLFSQNTSERHDLLIYREDEKTLRVVKRTYRGEGQGIDQDIRHFEVREHSLIPFWVLKESPLHEWNIELAYGSATVEYPLASREDLFKIQHIFTGYEPVAYSERATCTVIYNHQHIFGALLRAGTCTGHGEVQLWSPSSLEGHISTPNSPTVVSPTVVSPTVASSSPSTSENVCDEIPSDQITSTTTMDSAEPSVAERVFSEVRSGTVSIFQDGKGKEVVVSSHLRPVVLVSLMKSADKSYKFLKVDSKFRMLKM
jgi:hypothetical protein